MSSLLDRVYEFVDYTQSHYGLDPLPARALLLTLLPTNEVPIWLIADSNTESFWDVFGHAACQLGLPDVNNIAYLRRRRPCAVQLYSEHELAARNDRAKIYYDSHWMAPQYSHARSMIRDVEAECVRCKVKLPVSRPFPPNAYQTMTEMLKRAVSKDFRGSAPRFIPPNAALETYIYLISKLAEEVPNPASLTRNIGLIPSAHAVLMGREKLEEEDWEMQKFILLGTLRPWRREMLQLLLDREHVTVTDLMNSGLGREQVRKEAMRLYRKGVLKWVQGKNNNWVSMEHKWRVDIGGLVEGTAIWW